MDNWGEDGNLQFTERSHTLGILRIGINQIRVFGVGIGAFAEFFKHLGGVACEVVVEVVEFLEDEREQRLEEKGKERSQ